MWKAPQGLPRPNYNEPKPLLSPLTLVENAQDGPASPHWWIHMVLPNSTMDGLTSLSGNAAFSRHYGRWPDPCPTHNSLLHLLPCEFFLNFLNFLKITDFYAHFSFVRWITATIMITFIECLLCQMGCGFFKALWASLYANFTTLGREGCIILISQAEHKFRENKWSRMHCEYQKSWV